jgi:hypothetical protein
MIEPATLRFLNIRLAELIQEYEVRKNRPGGAAILEELSELTVVRDELRKLKANDNTTALQQRSLPREFPNVAALYFRLNAVAQRIAKTLRDDPQRPELLNEFTRICLIAESLTSAKKEVL